MTATPPQTLPLAVAVALQQAITHHQAGQLQDAERLYRAILQAQPGHPDANHNLGVLAVQVKQPAAGLSYFKAALEARPEQIQFWLSYLDALIQTDQTDMARQVLAQGRELGLAGKAIEALAGRLGEEKRTTAQSNADYQRIPSPQEINTLVALFTAGRYAEAATLAGTLTISYPEHWFGWKVLGAVLKQMGRNADALAPMQKAVALSPSDAEVHCNLGATLQELGRLDEAEASYRQALRIKPDYAEAHSNLGIALKDLGQLVEAEASLRRALEIKPDYASAYNNLGIVLKDLGRLGEAEVSYRQALRIKPDYAKAHNNLGATLQELGRLDEADASYRQALVIKPDYAEALNAHAAFLLAHYATVNDVMTALNDIVRSLTIEESREAKSLFVQCVKLLGFDQVSKYLRDTMVRALTEPWGRSADLALAVINTIKLDPDIRGCIARADDAWPARLSTQDLFGDNGLKMIATDPLLHALLESAPICDIEMERFLTMARRALLEAAGRVAAADAGVNTGLGFYSALARQCFINEYVFVHTDDEIQKASDLRDKLVAALEAKTPVPVLWPLAVAAYFPLNVLPLATRLLDREWPEEVAAVLVQQVREPEQELQLRTTIPRLTNIEDEVSLLVQDQYEENPYPRWFKVAATRNAKNIIGYLCQQFPLASFERHGKSGNIDILIAGCGTGQHAIQTAQLFQSAQVLAVDLSLSSLSYAKRKTRELGLDSIEYAQADLLKLASVGRNFDVIESVGVLHHLAEPWTGWQILLSLLRPGGFMRLGFYSEVARRNIVRIRSLIAEQGHASTAEGIRQCRQVLMDLDKTADFGAILRSSDFFSISTCRDLLFHVQEQRMTLMSIDAFLRNNNLAFLGFAIDQHVLQAYKRRFPADRTATNLSCWQIFENENPDTFIGMYQFWIQKAG